MPRPETEAQLRARLRKNVPGHWVTIETGRTGRGVPDCHWTHEGFSTFIELKIKIGNRFRSPATANQIQWMNDHLSHGGKCCVIASERSEGGSRNNYKHTNRIYFIKCFSLISGITKIDDMQFEMIEVPFDWSKIRDKIIGASDYGLFRQAPIIKN